MNALGRLGGVLCAGSLTGFLAVCGGVGPPPPLGELRAEVARLREEAERTLGPDSLLLAARAGAEDVVLGLRTATVSEVVRAAGQLYLREVTLHIRPNAVVSAGDEVQIRAGPLSVTAGRWDVVVTIERVEAVLSVDSLFLSVADSTRLRVRVPVSVQGGTGDALVDFRWDAARATGVVCGDFDLRERFAGVVAPRTYELDGYFGLEIDSAGARALPVMEERIPVSPSPTDAGWRRVRSLLEEQNRLFNCGLAISPANIEAKLRDLLARGFSFRLPRSILRPIPLPVSLADDLEVAGRRAALSVRAHPPRLTQDWLWFTAEVGLAQEFDSLPVGRTLPRASP